MTDPSKYTLIKESAPYDELAKESFEFTLDEYDAAVNCRNGYWEELCGSFHTARDANNSEYTVILAPTITGTRCMAERYVKSFALEDPYLVNEFGLGHGWMLGISHLRKEYPSNENFETVEMRLRLTTSDGAQYYIEQNVGTTDNYIENYEGSDIAFRRCAAGEYPGAVYGLYHKDGRTEYFDSDGRNTAITDRFGNKITLAYTFTDTTKRTVSKINITDTLNNVVVYENMNLDPNVNIPFQGRNYNGKWRLTLNGKTVREYYTHTSKKTLYSEPSTDGGTTPIYTYPTRLLWVSNEAGEFTRYNDNYLITRFNCFLQPPLRSQLGWNKPLFSNDGHSCVVWMYDVTLPNGGEYKLSTEDSNRTFGTYGYRSYRRCSSVYSLNSADMDWATVKYIWGDFDRLDGQRGYNQGYCTIVQYLQNYRLTDDSGNLTEGVYSWRNYDICYSFNSQDQLISTTKTSYEAQSLSKNQESIPKSMVPHEQQKWKSETTTYSYGSEYARKPKKITTTHYDSSGTAAMTASESFVYDDKWNITSHTKPNGAKEAYTYDAAYSLPLTHTVQQDANTKITVSNTLTTDKKSIATSSVTRGGAVVGKTTFSYNTAGQIISQNDYLSSANYVTTVYEYGSGALPTSVSVFGVKTASGTTAASSPGFSAGTVARKQTYNDRGWITSQTDANGKTTSYQYDAVGRITKVTYPDNTFQTYSYDVSNDTVTYTDEAGSSWLCTYSKSGKLLTVKDLSNSQVLEAYTYDQRDRLLKKVTYGLSTPDQIVYYRYDTNGRIVEQGNVDAWGHVLYQESYRYGYVDDRETVERSTDGNGYAPSIVTTSYLDNMGNTRETERLLGTTVYKDEFFYDYLGNQIEAKSAYSASLGDDYSTQTTYDHAGRVLTAKNALKQTTTTKTYDWLGNLLTDTDPKGNVTHYTYDVLGRLIRVVAPLDSGRTSQTDYTYDPNGNIIEERTRTGSASTSTTARVTAYEYDNMGRVIQIKGNGKEDGKSGTNQFQYTQYVYDKLGNITKLYTGLHAPLTISGSGNVTSGGDSSYSVTQYDYDRYSRLVKQTDPLGNQETYTYDLNGNLTAQTDRRDVTTWNTFDAMGRVTCSAAGSDYLYFSYTPTNQLSETKAYGKTTTYTYDSLGRLISEETPYATKTFTYNAGDLRTSFKVADGDTVYLNNTYTYDSIGRLTKVNGSNAQATYTYDANGNLSTTTYNNNTSAVYSYNAGNLPTKVQNKKNTAVLSWYDYTYGRDGNQLTKKDNLGRETTYTYDGLNRLTKEAQTGSGAFTNSYTYDDYSNRAAATLAGTAASYTYDANNRLLSSTQGANTTIYAYDDQGNLTSAVLKYNGAEQNALICSYDGFNRLKKISDNNGETVYTYDADGRRTSKQTANGVQYYVWDGDQLAVAISPKVDPLFETTLPSSGLEEDVTLTLSVGTTYYAKVNGTVYSAVATHNSGQAELSRGRWDDTEIPEIPPDPKPETFTELELGGFKFSISDTTKRGTVYGPGGRTIQLYTNDPATALPTVSYIRGLSLVASVQNGVRTYYHYNAHGDVVQLTNSSGNVTKNYTYDAFGVEKNAAASDANPFRYCGEQFDSETGNYYLRARYYSPGVGRFTQEDTHWGPGNMIYGDKPLQLHAYTYSPQITAIAQAGNLYFYALNNPVAYRDPSGDTALVDTWTQNAQFLPQLDGPHPYTDAIYAIGTGIAFLIDLALANDAVNSSKSTSEQSSSTSRGGAGFTRRDHSGGGFSKEVSSSKSTSQSATGSGETAGGGPNRNWNKLKEKYLEKRLREQNTTPHEVKQEYLGKKSETSKL